jgi:hypothetical protein
LVLQKTCAFVQKVFVDSVNEVFDFTDKIAGQIVRGLTLFARNPLALFNPAEKGTDYHADEHRASTQLLTILIIFSFVVFAIVSLFLN